MPQGVALYQAVRDASGTLLNFRLVDMNDTWIHLMGANPTEQPGLLLTDMEGFVEPTHLGIFRCVVTTGEPQIFRQYQPLTRRHFRVLVTSLHEGWIATTIDVAIAAEDPLPFPPRIQTPHAADSIGALAGGMAHTINNQLTAILGNAQFALQSLSPNSPAYPMLEEINNASLRVADLCNKLLRYAGKSPYQMETITVASLINEICPVLECSVPPTISIFFCVPNNLPDITADREELRQVLTGLVANAMEAIGDRVGKIIVAAGSTNCKRRYLHNAWLGDDAKEGEYVYLEVRDTGSGMSHETQKRIFDPFYSTKFMGRGLGLAATLGIVRAHHGVIKVHSQIGKGTSIRILFPKAESQNSHDRATAPLDQYAFYTSNAVADS